MIEKLRLSERNEGKGCPNFICIIECLVFFKKFFIECGGGWGMAESMIYIICEEGYNFALFSCGHILVDDSFFFVS